MQEFDTVLTRMVEQGLITPQTAMAHATNRTNLRLMLGHAAHAGPTAEADIIMLASDRDTQGG